MMCSTFSTSTAYCITERQLKSVWTTTFATFRCTNISPGTMPTSCVAGTRLSEHPTQRKVGDCCLAKVWKNPGSCAVILSAQARFWSSRRFKSFIGYVLEVNYKLTNRQNPGPHVHFAKIATDTPVVCIP